MSGGLQLILKYSKEISKKRGFAKSRVFLLRSLVIYKAMEDWLKFIDLLYLKYGFSSANWSLTVLPIRSYISSKLKTKEVVRLLKSHYSFISNNFKQEEVRKLLSGEALELCQLKTKNDEILTIKIAILEKYWRDGGFTIYISDEDNSIISTLTFNFYIGKDGKNAIIIGGMQGTASGKSTIVSTTRGLRGLRPKYALTSCCYNIADFFGIKSIIGISNENHIFSGKKYDGRVNSNYNEFWEEIGAVNDSDKNYQLPQSLPKRNFEDVQQKKRKDWLARQEYLAQIEADVNLSLKYLVGKN